MSDVPVYEVMAQAFAAEGTKMHFTVMGDANMFWGDCLAKKFGVKNIHVRHEHAAVSMADGYFRATGEVGVASTTCGPGFTQIGTALTMAVRGNIPLVVFAGDQPTNAAYFVQWFDPGPFATSTGAHFIQVRHIDRALDNIREAFHVARFERRPVVLSVPMDMQKQKYPHLVRYRPSTDYLPAAQRPHPDPALVDQAVAMIAEANRPIILGGRGAARSGAGPVLEALAEQCGALLGTSLLGKGLFDRNPFAIGTAGAFASDLARQLWAECDLVVGVGAGLGHYTTEGGYLYPKAKVIQIDTNPRGLWQGLRTADLHIRADAKVATEAILAKVREKRISSKGVRTPELAKQIAENLARPDPKELPLQPNLVDPRAAMLEFDRAIPRDWDIVVGSAHFFSIVLTHMRNRDQDRYHVINDFGAIGSGLTAAMGIAAVRNNGKVVLIDGDGSLLQHIQELETIKRHKLRLLVCTLNDGAYASEAHKFRAAKMDPSEAVHGRCDFASVARGFGLRGATVNSLGRCESLLRDYVKSDTAEIWDVHIDDLIMSRLFRRVWFGEV